MTTQPDHLPPLICALLDPAAYPSPVDQVTLIQTHVSYLLLAGDRAYKIKKPLNLGFLDFSTLDQRRYFCHHEVELNRRLCPQVYLGVQPITMLHGRARIGGAGPPDEWAVVMQRLPAERMLPTLLATDQIGVTELSAIARRLAEFHAGAATGGEIDQYGAVAAIRRNTDENFLQLQPFIGQTLLAGQYTHLKAAADRVLSRQASLFAQRIAEGRIRDCHGDVHAGSICLADEVLIFDCIEFNDRFRYGDVAAEVAFLAMDLDHFGRADLAWQFLEAYRHYAGDTTIGAELDFYKAYRAIVRGKVESLRSIQPEVPAAERVAAAGAARAYFDLAFAYTGGIARPTLLICCGLMGTGKTTLASALSQRLAMVHLASDRIRKRQAGLALAIRRHDPFGEGLYASAMTERVYAALLAEATTWLKRGVGVILDASFTRRADRDHARALAAALDLPAVVVETTAPEDVIRQRLEARLTEPGTISDGRWEIFAQQRDDFEPCRELPTDQHLVIEMTRPLDNAIDQVREHLAHLVDLRLREPLDRLGPPTPGSSQVL